MTDYSRREFLGLTGNVGLTALAIGCGARQTYQRPDRPSLEVVGKLHDAPIFDLEANPQGSLVDYLRRFDQPAFLSLQDYHGIGLRSLIGTDFINEIQERYRGRLQVVGLNSISTKDSLSEEYKKRRERWNGNELNMAYPNFAMLKKDMQLSVRETVGYRWGFPQRLIVTSSADIVYHDWGGNFVFDRPIEEVEPFSRLMTAIERVI